MGVGDTYMTWQLGGGGGGHELGIRMGDGQKSKGGTVHA